MAKCESAKSIIKNWLETARYHARMVGKVEGCKAGYRELALAEKYHNQAKGAAAACTVYGEDFKKSREAINKAGNMFKRVCLKK